MLNVPNTKYIRKNGNTYQVRKWINNKLHFYGSFKTLEAAMKYRDMLIKKGWSSNLKFKPYNYLIRQRTETRFEVYKQINGKQEYFGSYPSLEEAIKTRDLVIKYNGDWDKIVEDDSEQEYSSEKIKYGKVFFETKPRDDSFMFFRR